MIEQVCIEAGCGRPAVSAWSKVCAAHHRIYALTAQDRRARSGTGQFRFPCGKCEEIRWFRWTDGEGRCTSCSTSWEDHTKTPSGAQQRPKLPVCAECGRDKALGRVRVRTGDRFCGDCYLKRRAKMRQDRGETP